MEGFSEIFDFVRREWGDLSYVFVASAPGRANIIGEHTDYNMGFVMPFATNLKTFAFLRKRKDKVVKVSSLNLKSKFQTTLEKIRELKGEGKKGDWWKYILGPAYILLDGIDSGFEILVFGNVPLGGGVSSSASLQVAVTCVISRAFSLNLDKLSLARVARESENIFVGVPCGVMDQMTSVFGKKDHALIINCKNLEFDYVKIPDSISFVLCDSGVRHSLASSEYALRRKECETALGILKAKYNIENLSDIQPDMLDEIGNSLPSHLFKRVRFVVEENARVKELYSIFQNYDEKNEGKIKDLFFKSHYGLRYQYEVSCRELDILFDIAFQHPGVIGARMMGGGFGGNTINLVKKGYEQDFSEFIKLRYSQMTGISPRIIQVYPDGGATFEEMRI